MINYLLGYIVCSLLAWLILHDYDAAYRTPAQADDDIFFLVNAVIFSPITIAFLLFILLEALFWWIVAWVKRCDLRFLPILLMLLALLVFLMLTLTGCAGYSIDSNGSVSTYGLLRTLTVRNEYYESGALKSNTVSTDSTTKDALLGLDHLVDSAVNTAAKLKP